jgi:parvulin-like peptidyl-prolyl isomerase
MLKRVLTIVVAVVVFIAGNVAISKAAADRTLASVNGEAIFESEFNSLFEPYLAQYKQFAPPAEQTEERINELRKEVLDQLINRALMRQQAKKQGIKASSKEIRDTITQFKNANFRSEADFREWLKARKLSNSDFEKEGANDRATNTLLRKIVEGKVQSPTEPQVKDFFDKVQLKLKGRPTGLSQEDDQLVQNIATQLKRVSGPQVEWRMIFVSDPKGAPAETSRLAKEKVKQVQEALKKTDFAQVAAQYSDHEVSRKEGGRMGIVAKGDLTQAAPALDRALFNLAEGKVTSTPIKTDEGHFFLKVDKTQKGRELTFNDVEKDLAELVYQNDVRKFLRVWTDDLRSKAAIRINM